MTGRFSRVRAVAYDINQQVIPGREEPRVDSCSGAVGFVGRALALFKKNFHANYY
jgi:hypothetical protein